MLLQPSGPMSVNIRGKVLKNYQQERACFGDIRTHPVALQFSKVKVSKYPASQWNGTFISCMHMLYSVNGAGANPGTEIRIVDLRSSPVLQLGNYRVPNADCCIENFASVRNLLTDPFRGTFRGRVVDLKEVSYNNSGNAKREFDLVDDLGAFVKCCAMFHNAGSTALVESNKIVIYWATGRGPIGGESGELYAYRDALIVCHGQKFLGAPKRMLCDIIKKS